MKTGVTNANNPGTSATYTVAEGNSFVALATATDVDGGNPTIGVNGGADEAYFDFSGGQLILILHLITNLMQVSDKTMNM